MKKIILMFVIALAVTSAVFAQDYTVQEVKGRVERETGNTRVALTAGDTIDGQAVIHTGVGARLVLKKGDNTYTVPGMKNGKVSELAVAASAASVTLNGNIIRVDTDLANRTTGQVSTAAARAGEAEE